jgi:diguanylate cyclase (GGDEF)-like protein
MRHLKRSFFSPYVPWRLLGVLFLLDLVFIFYYLTRPGPLFASMPAQSPLYLASFLSVFGPLLSGIFCLKGTGKHLRAGATDGVRKTCRFSPLWWSASGFLFAVVQAIWFGQMLVTHTVPGYPSSSHFIELLNHFVLIGGVLLLPTRSISLVLRLRIFLDSLIIMTAIATLCYYYVLAPLLVHGDGTFMAMAVGGAHPALGLLLMFCVLLVALRSGERALRPVLIFLGIAAVLQFVAYTMHLYELLYRNYNELSVANVGMIFFGTLIVGAAQTVNGLLDKGRIGTADWRHDDEGELYMMEARWKILLPSILVLVFGCLVCAILIDGEQHFSGQIVIVYIGGAIVLALVFLRQFVTLYQVYSLQKKLQLKNHSLDVLNNQLAQQATTDALTELPNHRALAEKLHGCLEQARHTDGVCSVVFMDIDHFKATNDHYGHLVGDAVLGSFARIAQRVVRARDTVGRWGGEEFVAILPDTESEEAFRVAERIRVAVNQQISRRVGVPGLTCSLGVATFPQDASECEGLIRLADTAMYTSKRQGRNQTCLARESRVLARKRATQALEENEKVRVSQIAEALLALVEARDPALGRHGRRVAALALKLARELGLNEEEAYIVGMGGLLHDLGDITMPDALLFKRSQVDERELEERARYPRVGAEILSRVRALQAIADIVRAHCECVDGSGYPNGLKGEEIPLGARIVAVASAYDTALGERSSRRIRSASAVLRELRRATGSRFDPRIVDALEHLLALAPRRSGIDIAS